MAKPSYNDLLDIIAKKDRQIARLETRVVHLEETVKNLTRQLDASHRAGKRQAAPFSKGNPNPNPKRPGRKPGADYGPRAHRPIPERKPDEIIDVPLPDRCPDCSGAIDESNIQSQIQEDIPRKPIIRRFDIHIGHCRKCGKRIQPRHEKQTSDALGAAASQTGPDVQAMIAMMKNKFGLSYGKIKSSLRDFYGIHLSRGGATHITLRTAEKVKPAFDNIRNIVRQSRVLYADETGWRIGGDPQWLWAFVTPDAVAYLIRPSRGYIVPEEILGLDWNGRMNHDGWRTYDKFIHATHQQCLAHLIRRAKDLVEDATGRAVRFPKQVKRLFQDALALRDRRDDGRISVHGLAVARGRLEKRLGRFLQTRCSHEGNRKFRNHLSRYRKSLFTFLRRKGLEATNWPAEQAIRPAVVNRKTFGGNRTEPGARAQEILSSVLGTFQKRLLNGLDVLSHFLCLPEPNRPTYAHALLPIPDP